MRTIKYLPKITMAKTVYCEIDKTELAWIQTQLIRYLSVMGEMSINRDDNVRSVLSVWWTKRSPSLPKGSTGQNSPLSFVSGLLNNLLFGTQRDLTEVQMSALVNISAVMVQFLDAIEAIDKTKTAKNESMIFQIALFQ